MNNCRHLADMSCTGGALLRTSHELVLSTFVSIIYLKAPPAVSMRYTGGVSQVILVTCSKIVYFSILRHNFVVFFIFY